MTPKSDFMRWIDHQIDTNTDLKQKIGECLNEMMIEQKTGRLRGKS
jgi:hypothetical protein